MRRISNASWFKTRERQDGLALWRIASIMHRMADTERRSPLPPPLKLMEGASLFLDFDGTLVPLVDEPDAVSVDAELRTLLSKLQVALNGRVAIVSGRSIAVLREFLGLRDFILAGSHGLEFALPGKAAQAPDRLPAIDEAEAVLSAFAAGKPGLLIERKTLSVGLHFRKAPIWGDACRELAETLAEEKGLFLQHANMLYELRPGGADKGSALRRLMTTSPLNGGVPVFIGDDVTDEDGFEAAAELGGSGILVGAERATSADWRLEDPAAVKRFLRESAVHLVELQDRTPCLLDALTSKENHD